MRRLTPPAFWQHGGTTLLPTLLHPASLAVASLTARRVARPGWRAPVPVICCGNAGVGGAGKTTLVLDLAARLQASGLAVHLLTRGHGGRARGPLRVDPASHDAAAVGDEALLLAAVAPTWVGADRAATARLAIAAGAQILLMDDGLQNPSLAQDCALLVIDGAAGFGNGRVLPAGPLREPVRAAAARVKAAVLIGADATGALAQLPETLPVLRARLVPGPGITPFIGHSVLAFAGIGRPAKFFTMLEDAGVHVVARHAWPDHHAFLRGEVPAMVTDAKRLGARAVTTPKDYVRIPRAGRLGITPIGVSLAWDTAQELEEMLRCNATL
jgi:tetraacyldisaccharide 4'-kinase